MFLLPAFSPEDWMQSALCAQIGGDLWFPDQGDGAAAQKAKKVCAQCPVINTCLAYSLTNNELHGVWGGRSPEERKQLRRTTGGRETGIQDGLAS